MNFNNPKSNPQRPLKFLTRNLKFCHQHLTAFIKIRVKAYYLKKLLGPPEEEVVLESTYQFVSDLLKHKKIFSKTLRHAQLSSYFGHRINDSFKNSKTLKSCLFEVLDGRTPHDTMFFYLRKLPPTIRGIKVLAFVETEPLDKEKIYGIARCMGKFPKLQSFQRGFLKHYPPEFDYIQKEMTIYSQAALRLKELRKMTYWGLDDEQAAFQRMMKRDVIFPGITSLWLNLSHENLASRKKIIKYCKAESHHEEEDVSLDFESMNPDQQETYRKAQRYLSLEDEKHNDDIENVFQKQEGLDWGGIYSRAEWEFFVRCLMREEAKPFYRFGLFPNLKELRLEQEYFLVPLGSFIVEGFRTLQNLQKLKIIIWKRSPGTVYLFKAFLQLPLLKKFSLTINFLKNEDWAFFQHFLHVQKMIQSFSFYVIEGPLSRNHYLQQNSHLSSTLQYLHPKPFLKSLNLNLPYFSLVNISKGLKNLSIELHKFKLSAFDDCITSQEKPWKRVEGLCQFLRSQRKFLQKLHMNLGWTLEDSLVTSPAKAISELSQLKELVLSLGHDCQNYASFWNTIQHTVPSQFQIKMEWPVKWSPDLAKYLQRLENLEKFTCGFSIFSPEKLESKRWFVYLFESLLYLKRLRTLRISALDRGLLESEDQAIANALLCLTDIKKIGIFFHNPSSNRRFRANTVEEVINKRQSAKSNYLFETFE